MGLLLLSLADALHKFKLKNGPGVSLVHHSTGHTSEPLVAVASEAGRTGLIEAVAKKVFGARWRRGSPTASSAAATAGVGGHPSTYCPAGRAIASVTVDAACASASASAGAAHATATATADSMSSFGAT